MTTAETFFTTGQPKESRPAAVLENVENAFPVGSSEWWLARLLRRMQTRNTRLRELRGYYLGQNETWRLASDAHRETFAEAFKNLRANFAKSVVEAVEQRMSVQGFTLWDDDDGSDMAWELWTQNTLEAASSEAHLEMLSVGICPVIVNPLGVQVAPGIPLITTEDPLQVVVEHDVADRRRRTAAMKVWAEDDGRRTAVLYLPDRVEWWRTEQKYEEGQAAPRWRIIEGEGGPNRLGVVPVVELRNVPRAEAEHEHVRDQLRTYAATLYQMLTAGYHLSFPQRNAAGVEFGGEDPERDATGQPVAPGPSTTRTGPNRIVWTENPDAKFDQWEAATLAPFVLTLDAIKSDISIITSTPQRLLVPQPTSVPPSGESVRLSDRPLTKKVQRRQTAAGNGWETVIRLGFLAQEDQARARRMDLSTEWENAEEYTFAELMDGLTKARALGVPPEALWRRFGATPQEIRRWRRDAEARATASPTPPGTSDPTEDDDADLG